MREPGFRETRYVTATIRPPSNRTAPRSPAGPFEHTAHSYASGPLVRAHTLGVALPRHQHDPRQLPGKPWTFRRRTGNRNRLPPLTSRRREGLRRQLAYVATSDRSAQRPDAMAVLDTTPDSATFGSVVGWTEMQSVGNELHHFGSNAHSSALCPHAPHPHPHVERRHFVAPGCVPHGCTSWTPSPTRNAHTW